MTIMKFKKKVKKELKANIPPKVIKTITSSMIQRICNPSNFSKKFKHI